jgi:hypothetical protein
MVDVGKHEGMRTFGRTGADVKIILKLILKVDG